MYLCKIISRCFFHFFKILISWVVSGVKEQRMLQNDKKLCLLYFISQEPYICRLPTAKFQSARGASHQPAFVDSSLIISHTCFPCPPSRWISPCVLFSLMIWLIVVLLMFFLHGEYHGGWHYFREWKWNSMAKLWCNTSREWDDSRVSQQELDFKFI